jgi:hypothetical protein
MQCTKANNHQRNKSTFSMSVTKPESEISQSSQTKENHKNISFSRKIEVEDFNKSHSSESAVKDEYYLTEQEENSLVISSFIEESFNIDSRDFENYKLNNISHQQSGCSIFKLPENPARKIINFSKFSNEVLRELNKARRYPVSYARKLRKLIDDNYKEIKKNGHIQGILNFKGYAINLKDKKSSFEEAIKFLMGQPAQQPFIEKEKLYKSANDLLNILILHDGLIGSNNKDSLFNSKLLDTKSRISKYGVCIGESKEILDYGSFDPEQVVLNLIVCDGNPTKKTREIIFSSKFKFAAVCSGITPSDKVCTVINFCEMFFQKGDIIPGVLLKTNKINPKCLEEVHINYEKNTEINKTKTTYLKFIPQIDDYNTGGFYNSNETKSESIKSCHSKNNSINNFENNFKVNSNQLSFKNFHQNQLEEDIIKYERGNNRRPSLPMLSFEIDESHVKPWNKTHRSEGNISNNKSKSDFSKLISPIQNIKSCVNNKKNNINQSKYKEVSKLNLGCFKYLSPFCCNK